jgi:hypothetical protein
VLSLAYFNYKGLTAQLKRIPLEYFRRALQWLAKQPGVDPKRLVTWGVSRGEEAALLLGTTYPTLVQGVVGYVGSDQVFGDPLAPKQPSWTVNGKAIAIGTLIPVETVNGPLFLVGAGDDGLGESVAAVESMVRMLREHKPPRLRRANLCQRRPCDRVRDPEPARRERLPHLRHALAGPWHAGRRRPRP